MREDFNRHEVEEARRFEAVEDHLKHHGEELKKLGEDFNKLSHWMIGVAGYRWGMASEKAFREAVDYVARSLGYS